FAIAQIFNEDVVVQVRIVVAELILYIVRVLNEAACAKVANWAFGDRNTALAAKFVGTGNVAAAVRKVGACGNRYEVVRTVTRGGQAVLSCKFKAFEIMLGDVVYHVGYTVSTVNLRNASGEGVDTIYQRG